MNVGFHMVSLCVCRFSYGEPVNVGSHTVSLCVCRISYIW